MSRTIRPIHGRKGHGKCLGRVELRRFHALLLELVLVRRRWRRFMVLLVAVVCRGSGASHWRWAGYECEALGMNGHGEAAAIDTLLGL